VEFKMAKDLFFYSEYVYQLVLADCLYANYLLFLACPYWSVRI
jgi:hypothetical protein